MATTELSRCSGRRVFIGLAILLPVAAFADSSLELLSQDGLISVRANGAPLRSILEQLAVNRHIDIVSSEALLQPTSIEADAIPLHELLRRLLRGHSYIHIDNSAVSSGGVLRILNTGRSAKAESWQLSHPSPTLGAAIVNLTDIDPEVREEAVLTLGDIGDPPSGSIVPLLQDALRDPSPGVREAAEAVLDAIDDVATDPDGRRRLNE